MLHDRPTDRPWDSLAADAAVRVRPARADRTGSRTHRRNAPRNRQRARAPQTTCTKPCNIETDNVRRWGWQLYTLLNLNGTLFVNQCDEPLGPHARAHARERVCMRTIGRCSGARRRRASRSHPLAWLRRRAGKSPGVPMRACRKRDCKFGESHVRLCGDPTRSGRLGRCARGIP